METAEADKIRQIQANEYTAFARRIVHDLQPDQAVVIARVQALFMARTPALVAKAKGNGHLAFDRARDFLRVYAPDLVGDTCAVACVASTCQMIAAQDLDEEETPCCTCDRVDP